MTDINIHHSLQNDIIQEEEQQEQYSFINETTNNNLPEESDITEAAIANIVYSTPKPSPPRKRLHDDGDSESEQDVTEEHVDTNLLSTRLNDVLHLNTPPLETILSNQQVTHNARTLQQSPQPTETMSNPIPTSTSHNNNNSNIITSRSRSASSASPSTIIGGGGLLPRSQRVWEMDRQAPECRRCHRRFNFLVRRHHCRRCGQIVCDKCSSNRIRLPIEELIEDPMISTSQYNLLATQSQRVCDNCYKEPIKRYSSEYHSKRLRSSSTRPVNFGNQMRRTNSSQSLMIDCPVCENTFLGMQKKDQEQHLQSCLNVGSPPVQSPRYIVYELSHDSTQIGDECPICFDEFKQGDKISRMICLCSYHQRCLADWLERGKGCPVHYDPLVQN